MSSNIKRVASNNGSGGPMTALQDPGVKETPPENTSTFLAALEAALRANDIRQARCLVAEEEVRQIECVGANHAAATAEISAAKAKIALATDDSPAAHAILLSAIEATPDNRSLRVLMSEIMLASGRASDVRPVMKHLGKRTSGQPDQAKTARDAH